MIQKTIFGEVLDRHFMAIALKQAIKSALRNEVPVGAIVVNREGKIIARASNAVEKECSQRAHAESLAIEKAGKKLGNWRLEGCWLYVTLQPCVMCMGLIRLSRLDGIVYGTTSPLFGSGIDTVIPSQVYKSDLVILGGVLQNEAAVLLKEFFQNKRKEKR